MSGHWKEVVSLRFKGERFRDHALDLSALSELSQFQKLVAETAKALWRAANPASGRLPNRFEERTRLCLRRIGDGSAVVPLEVYVEEPEDPAFWAPEPVEANQAIELTYEVFEAAAGDGPLPERLPKHLVSEYAKWGESLAEDEEVEFAPPGKRPARVCARCRDRLASFAETPYEEMTEATGEVLEADVRQQRFQLWIDERTSVAVPFSDEQEDAVTTALKDHRSVRLKVTGRGERSPDGRLLRFSDIDTIELLEVGPAAYEESAPPIEETLAAISAEIPDEEWRKLPPDLSGNLDYYLHGEHRP